MNLMLGQSLREAEKELELERVSYILQLHDQASKQTLLRA